MKESQIQSIFKVWLANNPPSRTTVYEIKLEKKKSIAFDRVYDHQIAGLRMAKHKGLYHKISDVPFGHAEGFRFHKKKPFDCMYLIGCDAFIVVVFYVPREKKEAMFIDVDVWESERGMSMRKSLTKERAQEIAAFIEII